MTDFEDLFERTMTETPATLSASGAARRDAMRARLRGAVVSRRRRRTAVRWSAFAVVVLAAAGLIWRLSGPFGADGTGRPDDPGSGRRLTAEHEAPRGGAAKPSAGVSTHIAIVRDDESILERTVASAPASAIETVDDRELLRLLASANRPTGLIRSGRRVILTRPVTDVVALHR